MHAKCTILFQFDFIFCPSFSPLWSLKLFFIINEKNNLKHEMSKFWFAGMFMTCFFYIFDRDEKIAYLKVKILVQYLHICKFLQNNLRTLTELEKKWRKTRTTFLRMTRMMILRKRLLSRPRRTLRYSRTRNCWGRRQSPEQIRCSVANGAKKSAK